MPSVRLIKAALVLPVLCLAAACGDATDVDSPAVTDILPPTGDPLANRADATIITLSGTVASTAADSFLLDYGSGRVSIEMDDWDWYQEGNYLARGDEVTVSGVVDRDMWETGKVEASSVYVRNLGTYFYANSADEEEFARPAGAPVARPAGTSDALGYITAIEGREFTIGTGDGAVRVDSSAMANNPLDASGRPQLKVGSRVYVWGRLQVDPKEGAELMATDLVELLGNSRAGAGAALGTGTGSPPPSPQSSAPSSPPSSPSPSPAATAAAPMQGGASPTTAAGTMMATPAATATR